MSDIVLDGLVPPMIVATVAALLIALCQLFVRRDRHTLATTVLILALTALGGGLERQMGRSLIYRHGPVRFWSGDVQSDQNSQQVTDPYTFTHVTHGALFYGVARLMLPRASLGLRALVATTIEVAWEVYENTDTVIERYRTATIALGYYGDSVLNSVADIGACLVGFFLTWRLPRRVTLVWVATFEIVLAVWIRDNLTLNVLMLLWPLDAVRRWQMSAM